MLAFPINDIAKIHIIVSINSLIKYYEYILILYMYHIGKRSSSLISESDELNLEFHKCNIMSYLLNDTSIDKATSDKTKADRMIEVVSNKHRLLNTQRVVRGITQRRREIQEAWENCIKEEINRYNKNKEIAELAAISIQKIVRGFLIRIKIEPMLLDLREASSKLIIKELRTQTDICMLSLGTNTIPVCNI